MSKKFAGKTPFNASTGISFDRDCIRVRDGMVKIGTKKGDEVVFTYEEGRLALEIMPDLGFRGPAWAKSSFLTIDGWK